MKHVVRLLAAVMLLSFGSSLTMADPGDVLEAVVSRGTLNCGINANLPGFSSQPDGQTWEGFDVDVCRAVAAAVLGDADAVAYTTVTAADRPLVLQLGAVDMLSRNTTVTLSRDTDWNARFGPVTFYDGQGVMVRRESGITNLNILAGGSVCVETGTTTETNMRDVLTQRDLPYRILSPEGDQIFESAPTNVPTTTLRTYRTADEMMTDFFLGRCDAVTTDKSGLAARRAGSDDPEAIVILSETYSKEPLAPLSPDNDPEFSNVILWTVNAMIQAEEMGITSANIDEFAANPTPEIERFLGTGSAAVGDYLGIPNDFAYQVIKQVGNYGEVYERHLGLDTPLGLDRGLNELWTEGGLLYSPPFR